MINRRGSITINSGMRHLSEWPGMANIPTGKVIINKVVTGCGMTSYYLTNSENIILAVPRIQLAKNKTEQIPYLFYFDREIEEKEGIGELENLLSNYLFGCQQYDRPIKLICTYDSFPYLIHKLNLLQKDLNEFNRVVVDESQSVLKDAKMKESKDTITQFLNAVFKFGNVLFVSATPMAEYLEQIPQFKFYNVDYYEFAWDSLQVVTERKLACRSALDAFDKIHKQYTANGFFSVLYDMSGNATYSREALIFLNDVADIVKIVKKYGIAKYCNVICGNNNSNRQKLKKVGLSVGKIPLEKDVQHNKTFTFITRTAFEGCDFYSTNASTFVIADYNVKCLAIDIASDIPQIIGRMRSDYNPFKNQINVFYVGNKQVLTDEEFQLSQQEKLALTKRKIANFMTAEYKEDALNDIRKLIQLDPNEAYLSTANGVPEVNNLLILAEKYSFDILKNHQSWFAVTNNPINQNNQAVTSLKNELDAIKTHNTTRDRIRKIYEYVIQYPGSANEFMAMLSFEGYSDLAYYFHKLPLERIKYNSGDPTKMDAEIQAANKP